MGKIKIRETLLFLWRKRFVVYAVLFPILLFLGGWAFWYEPSSLTVENYELKIAGWNPAHNNLKIVAISDIHAGSNFIDGEKIRKIVDLTNSENADLIVLLGDYVSEETFNPEELKMPVSKVADNLAGLKAKHGVYAVIGNHDFLYDTQNVRTELERVGIRVLDQETVTINPNNQNLTILGLAEVLQVHDWYAYANGAKETMKKATAAGNVLVLVHNPDALAMISGEFLISENLRLILAGHTHGGQVSFPLIGPIIVPSNYGEKFARGHIKENGIDMFITPGIGSSILPVRFGVPPEISVLTISASE